MIPQTFEQWKNCIIHDCNINLNQAFAQKRLAVYLDRSHPETKQFVLLYGENHLQNIIRWMEQV